MTSRYRRTPQGELQGNGTPALSIAIASVNGYRSIVECHRSLAKQRHRDRGEVIVVKGCADITAMQVAQAFPWVRPIARATPKPIPEMRSIGNQEAKAPTDGEGAYVTSVAKVFAAGDVRRGQSLVVWAQESEHRRERLRARLTRSAPSGST